MPKALIDTSTFVDIGKAVKHRRASWAQNTLRHLLAYKASYPKLTLSALTIFEHLDGLYRDARLTAVKEFSVNVLPDFEVIYPDHEILRRPCQGKAEHRCRGYAHRGYRDLATANPD